MAKETRLRLTPFSPDVQQDRRSPGWPRSKPSSLVVRSPVTGRTVDKEPPPGPEGPRGGSEDTIRRLPPTAATLFPLLLPFLLVRCLQLAGACAPRTDSVRRHCAARILANAAELAARILRSDAAVYTDAPIGPALSLLLAAALLRSAISAGNAGFDAGARRGVKLRGGGAVGHAAAVTAGLIGPTRTVGATQGAVGHALAAAAGRPARARTVGAAQGAVGHAAAATAGLIGPARTVRPAQGAVGYAAAATAGLIGPTRTVGSAQGAVVHALAAAAGCRRSRTDRRRRTRCCRSHTGRYSRSSLPHTDSSSRTRCCWPRRCRRSRSNRCSIGLSRYTSRPLLRSNWSGRCRMTLLWRRSRRRCSIGCCCHTPP